MSEDKFGFLKLNPKFIGELGSNYKCTLCHKIMVQACSAPCGCEFCLMCAEAYFQASGDKTCPGSGVNCGDRELQYERDILEARGTDRRIAELEVECVWERCGEAGSVAAMANHVRLCEYADMQCPYWVLGCRHSGTGRYQMREHMLDAGLDHANLAVARFQSLADSLADLDHRLTPGTTEISNQMNTTMQQNHHLSLRMDGLTEQLTQVRADNDRLTVEAEAHRNRISNLEAEIAVVRQDNVNARWHQDSYKQANAQLFREIGKEISTLKDVSTSKKHNENFKRNKLEKHLNSLEKLSLELIEDVRKLREMVTNTVADGDLKRLSIDTVQKDVTKMETSCQSRIAGVVGRVDMVEKRLQSVDGAAFVWRVEDLPEKRAAAQRGGPKWLLSPGFYLGRAGYKLGLKIYPDGFSTGNGSHITVSFLLIKGDHDDALAWPCKLPVSLAMLDHEHGTEIKTYRFDWQTQSPAMQECFHRPSQDVSAALGQPRFMSWLDLEHNRSALRDGAVLLSCRMPLLF